MRLPLAVSQLALLAGLAAIFIAFALVSSFVLPRRNPDFPGRRLGWFVAATVALFVMMMAGVVFLEGEEDEGGEHRGESAPALVAQ